MQMKIQITEATEKQLILEAQRKRPEAFERLIKIHEVEIFSYIKKMMHNSYSSMDLLQETMIKAYQYIEKYDPQYSFKAWLYRIAKNTVIDEIRKKSYKTQQNCTYIEDNPQISITYNEPQDQLEYQSLKEALEAAIEKLPLKLKNLVVLCDIQELSYEEAARIEGITIGTIKSRLHRARNALRKMKHLKEYL